MDKNPHDSYKKGDVFLVIKSGSCAESRSILSINIRRWGIEGYILPSNCPNKFQIKSGMTIRLEWNEIKYIRKGDNEDYQKTGIFSDTQGIYI